MNNKEGSNFTTDECDDRVKHRELAQNDSMSHTIK